MRGSIARKIRKAARTCALSENDARTIERKTQVFGTAAQVQAMPGVFDHETEVNGVKKRFALKVTHVRVLRPNSTKFLAKRLKRVYNTIRANDRIAFFPAMAGDIAKIILKNAQKPA